MNTEEENQEIAAMAVEALKQAQRRALASGRPVVFVENGKLIRIDSTGKTVLRVLPEPKEVSSRSKRASN